MSFASDQGYTASTVADLMNLVRLGINEQFGTSYDTDTFLGTNFYKYFYALVQRLQLNEVKTAEIVLKLQQYFAVTNEKITRPNTTHPGLVDYMTAAGYTVATKAPIDADAGKLYVAVDVDETAPTYAATKLAICTQLSKCAVAGVVTQGTETAAITLSNNQSFDFKYNLPTRIAIKLKLTLVTSANNQFQILSPQEIADKLYANIRARYRLGLAFEPQRYFSVLDAPWAASVTLQYSLDGGTTWTSAIAALAYNQLYTFTLADITIVET